MPREVAYFVTPHGYGHATRAAAVMAAVQKRDPEVRFRIFTQAPERIFVESLPGAFAYCDVLTDLGLVQISPLEADLDASLHRLDAFLPFDADRVADLTGQVRGCGAVCCDIAPLGLAVAQRAGVPSVLIENFTWDWIYAPFVNEAPGFAPHIAYLREVFASADYHVQTQPACDVHAGTRVVPPVSRAIRQPSAAVRGALGLPEGAKAVMITMGGTPFQYAGTGDLAGLDDVYFLLPNSGDVLRHAGNRVHIPRESPIFHPDLVNASDAVVGKVGYSTLAEVYWAGVPFGYIPRPGFRESDVLTPFIAQQMPGVAIAEADFTSGAWLKQVPDLLACSRVGRAADNGADEIAAFLLCEVLS